MKREDLCTILEYSIAIGEVVEDNETYCLQGVDINAPDRETMKSGIGEGKRTIFLKLVSCANAGDLEVFLDIGLPHVAYGPDVVFASVSLDDRQAEELRNALTWALTQGGKAVSGA